MKKIIILLVAVLSMAYGYAQELDLNTQTLSWNVVSVKSKANSETISRQSEIIVYTKDKIEWIQPEAARTYTFDILSIDGSWSDAANDGTIKYVVELGDSQGTITFQRAGSAITIDLDLKRGEKVTFPFILSIDSITKK